MNKTIYLPILVCCVSCLMPSPRHAHAQTSPDHHAVHKKPSRHPTPIKHTARRAHPTSERHVSANAETRRRHLAAAVVRHRAAEHHHAVQAHAEAHRRHVAAAASRDRVAQHHVAAVHAHKERAAKQHARLHYQHVHAAHVREEQRVFAREHRRHRRRGEFYGYSTYATQPTYGSTVYASYPGGLPAAHRVLLFGKVKGKFHPKSFILATSRWHRIAVDARHAVIRTQHYRV